MKSRNHGVVGDEPREGAGAPVAVVGDGPSARTAAPAARFTCIPRPTIVWLCTLFEVKLISYSYRLYSRYVYCIKRQQNGSGLNRPVLVVAP